MYERQLKDSMYERQLKDSMYFLGGILDIAAPTLALQK